MEIFFSLTSVSVVSSGSYNQNRLTCLLCNIYFQVKDDAVRCPDSFILLAILLRNRVLPEPETRTLVAPRGRR